MGKDFNGFPLAVYDWEYTTYREFYSFELKREEAGKYIRKFSRHFKTITPYIDMTSKLQGGGRYFYGDIHPRIALPKNTNLGSVCHEYAHHLTRTRNPLIKRVHGKEFKRELKKVYTFAKRYLPKD